MRCSPLCIPVTLSVWVFQARATAAEVKMSLISRPLCILHAVSFWHPHQTVLTTSMTPVFTAGWRVKIEPCWQYSCPLLLETSGRGQLSCNAGGRGGNDEECNITSLQRGKCATVRALSNMSLRVSFHLISRSQYRLSLVEVCVVVESSGKEPRRPGPDRQCSRFCSSLDTLLEKAV